MRPLYADFTVDPPRLGGASIDRSGLGPGGVAARFAVNHLKLGAGESVALEFPDGALSGEQATLTLTALASMAGRSIGHAPMTLTLNGHELVSGLIIPGGGVPQDLAYAVAPEWLAAEGPNTLVIANGEGARTFLWLYRVTLEDGCDRGGARRELDAAAARESVLTYRTLTRSPDHALTAEGPVLRLHLDRGEQSLPSQLSWTSADGTHSAISFQSAMEEFSGVFRYAHGEPVALHGYLTSRAEYDPEHEPRGTRHFEVACTWGTTGWHAGTPLRLLLDDGRSDEVSHLAWRDQAGNSASVSFGQSRSGFVGYYQRRGEGPIGMRGTEVEPLRPAQARTSDPGEELTAAGALADVLVEEVTEFGRQVLSVAEGITERLSSWLQDRGK